jgi:hypothetical protein
MLREWTHSGFNIRRNHRVRPRNNALHLEMKGGWL